MSASTDWTRVKHLLDALADLPAAEREARLTELCPDADTRREVLELLRADEAMTLLGGLARPAASRPADPSSSASDQSGETLGRYRLLRCIGRGGMGTVYLAERRDEGLNQTVAVKLIHPELVDSGLRDLFIRERRILAGLEHPGICSMIDSGVSESGQPWFAMPYLEAGQPITAFCDQQRLDPRARIELFLQVTEAVQYAHRNLVVHGDLKPANLLVNPDGHVHLLDFGIARLQDAVEGEDDRADREQAATVDYASPEQLAGRPPTTQSDVYSLGLLLHRLVAGRLPSRTLAPELPTDLDAIIGQATSPRPEDRYGSVQALADDLRRYLSDYPVLAREPSVRDAATKFVRRHRWTTALGSALALALVGVLAVVLLSNQRLSEQAEQIRLERDRAEATARFWAKLFEQTDPVSAQRPVSGLEELLDRAQSELGSDPALGIAARASLLPVISSAQWNLARPEAARAAAERGAELAEDEATPTRTRVLAWKQLANIAYAQSDYPAARRAADRSLALLETLEPDPLLAAQVLDAHALILDAEGQTGQAARVMAEVVELHSALPPERVGADRSAALGNLAWMHFSLARSGDEPERNYGVAAGALEQAIEAARAHFGADHARVAGLLNAAGTLAMRRGLDETALASFEDALSISERTLPAGHSQFAHLHVNLGLLHWRLGQPQASREQYRQALEATLQSLPDNPLHLAEVRVGLARASAELDDLQALSRELDALGSLLPELAEESPIHLWQRLLESRLDEDPVDEALRQALLARSDSDLGLAVERWYPGAP
ncbi:hypothetical protein AY599_24630 [Leptolyngbya valderiana BDU 20041]|nr:hypothetical protein AY599_24630 [Leptolyngbya valderiana BDU 20041]